MSIFNTFPGNPGNATTTRDGLMSKDDKNKLDTIEKYANHYIHPDSHSANMIIETESRQFITKEERQKLNTTIEPATEEVSGLMSSVDKKKLNNIEDNANNYTHPVNHPASMIVQSSVYRFVTDTEKATWNAKANKSIATQEEDGLLSYTDKIKLDNIDNNANNYIHPSTHNAGMIVEDSTHRFVTDIEKAKWDNKAPKDVATSQLDGLMTKEDKAKLDTIASGANNYVHPNSHNATMITTDTTHRFVTDAQISTWDSKASSSIATITTNGLMSSTDKTKLDGIATGANNYVHPSMHDASIITQSASYRFVTDTEKSTWNAKASTAIATTSANGLMSSTDKTKLDGIATGANNYTHPATHDASMIIQSSVYRFVSDSEKSKWDNKPDDKVDIGLGNVTNDAQVKRSEMGVAGGVATLGSDGKVPAVQLPSFVDDVEEYDNLSSFPETGEAGKIYVDKTNNKTYRWSGSAYVVIGSDLALGETASTAYPGDKGKIVYDEIVNIKNGNTIVPKASDASTVSGFTVGVNVPANAKFTDTVYTHPANHDASMITQSASYRFVTDTEKSTWNAKASTSVATTTTNGLMSSTDKTKLDGIATGANNYVHPSTHNASMIVEDETHRFVTDSQISTWNAKASTSTATTSANGLMSSADKSKLDGISAGANNYVHPNAHDASMITQSASYRFVTDTEKATWNAKASTSIATVSSNGLMSSTDKSKLDGIAAGANNYTHPATHDASIISTDSTHRFVTDVQINTWNDKANAVHSHSNISVADTRSDNPAPNSTSFMKKTVSFDLKSNSSIDNPPASGSYSGMMSFAPWSDSSGGNGYELLFGYGSTATTPVLAIRTNSLNATSWGQWYELYTTANKPTPADIGAANSSHTHSASEVTQSASYRFVTDTQISTWNAKASNSVATQSANGLMSSTDKTKLDGIETNANNYTHPANHDASMITQSASYRFVTDTEKATWNAKASTATATTSANGLMSSAMVTKLNGIATGANNYVHPTTHDASIITQSASYRFVTDTQISTWDNKASTAVASTTSNGLMSSTDKSNLNSLITRVSTLESNYAAVLAKLKTAVFIG